MLEVVKCEWQGAWPKGGWKIQLWPTCAVFILCNDMFRTSTGKFYCWTNKTDCVHSGANANTSINTLVQVFARACRALNFMLVDYTSSESEEEATKRKRATKISTAVDANDRPLKKPQPFRKLISLPDPDNLLSGKVVKFYCLWFHLSICCRYLYRNQHRQQLM